MFFDDPDCDADCIACVRNIGGYILSLTHILVKRGQFWGKAIENDGCAYDTRTTVE